MKQIIKLIDVNVDGCGMNIESMIQVSRRTGIND